MDLSTLLTYDGMTLEIVIWSLFIGIVIGIFGAFYVKQLIGSFVRRLLEENASSPENAKTLEELGYAKNYFVIRELRAQSTFRKLVCAVNEDDGDEKKSAKQQRTEILANRWYIPEHLCDRAELMYEVKGNTIGIALIAVAAFFIAALVSFMIIPELVSLASDAVGSFGA